MIIEATNKEENMTTMQIRFGTASGYGYGVLTKSCDATARYGRLRVSADADLRRPLHLNAPKSNQGAGNYPITACGEFGTAQVYTGNSVVQKQRSV